MSELSCGTRFIGRNETLVSLVCDYLVINWTATLDLSLYSYSYAGLQRVQQKTYDGALN